jgi:Flp pilus assembly protein TadD
VQRSPQDKPLWDAHDLASTGDHLGAVAGYRAIIELNPSDPRPWMSLGVSLSKLQQWAAAVDALERAIALHPAYCEADTRIFLAEALLGAGNTARARVELEYVCGMEPSYPSYEEPMNSARRLLKETESRS